MIKKRPAGSTKNLATTEKEDPHKLNMSSQKNQEKDAKRSQDGFKEESSFYLHVRWLWWALIAYM